MSKNLVLMRDVVCKYHPLFEKSADLQHFGLNHSEHIAIEKLIEESLAAVGGYKFVDEEGYDFSDFSDSKTTTVNSSTGTATVMGVECKVGSLRIVCYNPWKETADYFFVAKNYVSGVKSPCYGKDSHKERIVFSYSSKYHDFYGNFERFRVKSFKDLALAR